ncbi:MAG: hypothetical protein ABI847_10065 [Anaerolineales bacterium]
MPLVLVGVVAIVLLIVWLAAPRGAPWAHALVRLRPGSGRSAEWMAPPEVVRAVKRDYLAALAWLAECSADWGLMATELDRYTSGAYFKREWTALGLLVQSPGPRLAAVAAADHHLVVRRFSSDGLLCLLIDHQTQRRMTTRSYWSGRALHAQALPDTALVFQIVFDLKDRRWKIDRLVQRLPRPASGPVPVTLAADLPVTAGRDA